MRCRALAAFSVVAIALLPSGALAQDPSAPDAGRAFAPAAHSKPLYDIQAPSEDPARQRHVIAAADGVDLFLETWLPKAKDGVVPPTRIPNVLVITPYATEPGATRSVRFLELLVKRGYAWSQMHVRGTGASGGCIELIDEKEADDGARAIEYLGRDAPWTDGTVGTFGISYDGGTQIAAATLGDQRRVRPYLKAMIPIEPSVAWYDGLFFDGVPMLLNQPGQWATYVAGSLQAGGPYEERLECVPENAEASADTSGDVTEWYLERDLRRGMRNVKAATLSVHGHADVRVQALSQVGFFDHLPEGTPRAGLFGVWGHVTPDSPDRAVRPEWRLAGFEEMVTAWFDRWLKGLPTGVGTWPAATVQGSDGQWRAELDWPQTGGPVGQLALGPDGLLGATTPEGSTSYTEGEPENTESEQSPETSAVFTSEALPGRLELTGQPMIDLWVSLDKPDAHLAAKLEALDEHGERIDYARAVGFRSARHLEPFVDGRFVQARGKPPPVGEPLHVTLRFNPVDLVVPKGGSLRLTFAGSLIAFDGLDGVQEGAGAVLQGPSQPSGSETRVTILHDCEHPTVLRFLMPRRDADLLDLREPDQPAETVGTTPGAAVEATGGGLATRAVCGARPSRNEVLGAPSAAATKRLRMRVVPRRVRTGVKRRIRVRVRDRATGDPVRRARVRLAGRTKRAGRRGLVVFHRRFARPGARHVSACARDYRCAFAKLRVRKR